MPKKAKENVTKINVENEKNKPKNKVDNKSSSKVKVPKKSTATSKNVANKTKVVSKSDDKKTVKKTNSNSKTSTQKKKKTTSLKNTKTSSKTKKVIQKDNDKNKKAILEYYDLPYRYNKTVVKALAQNPNTLFVYWEISDEDRNNFIKKYGEDFFNITKPVLIVHNITDKYSFEIEIDDFANNWYIHVNDTKCQYVIELGRRPKELSYKVREDYLYITSSNMIESPNDHVLFIKDTDKVYFKNIHTNKYTTKVIRPFLLNNIKNIYKEFNISDKENLNRFDFSNPSSQNPTSNF